MLDFQSRLGIYRHRSVDVKFHFRADHHFCKKLLVDVLCKNGAGAVFRLNMHTLSENRNAVGNLHNLVEFVGNDYNRLAVFLHFTQNVEKFLRFLRG